jgi:CspA family cold shock protein
VFVFFAVEEHFHQLLGKPFTGAPRLGAVCKRAVDAERAINWKHIHLCHLLGGSSLGRGKVCCFVSFRGNPHFRDANLGAQMFDLDPPAAANGIHHRWLICFPGLSDPFYEWKYRPKRSPPDRARQTTGVGFCLRSTALSI